MRKIINSTYITLDGVIQQPHLWPTMSKWDERAETLQTDLLRECDALIMGRHTYEVFAAAWPTRNGDPFSDRINSMRKYVVSSTIREPKWRNTSVVQVPEAVAEIRRLKQLDGGHIIQYGFGRLSHALLEHNLIDELRLWLHPLFLGKFSATDLLFREGPTREFDLVNTQTLNSGVIILTYAASNAASNG